MDSIYAHPSRSPMHPPLQRNAEPLKLDMAWRGDSGSHFAEGGLGVYKPLKSPLAIGANNMPSMSTSFWVDKWLPE